MRLAQAVAVARGFGLATSTANVPAAYADAVCSDEAEAAEVTYQTNAARELARVAARKGFR